jgi:hypothetical protein
MPDEEGRPKDNSQIEHIIRNLRDEKEKSVLQLGALMKSPAWYECAECQNMAFRILVDARGIAVQFQCGKCGAYTPPVEMHKLQVNEQIARQYPKLFVPFANKSPLVVDMEIETHE